MTDVIMPQMGESIAEGTIAVWLVEPGQNVEMDQPLVQVTTDKADIDIPSPVSGVLKEILAQEGVTVKVGELIARIDEQAAAEESIPAELPKVEGVPAYEAMMEVKGEEVTPPPEIEREPELVPSPVQRPETAMFYSPAVMRLAMEHGVDLNSIRGTGHDGRVTKSDVEKAIEAKRVGGMPPEAELITAQPSPVSSPVQPAPPTMPEATPTVEPAAQPPGGFGAYRPPTYTVEEGDTPTQFTHLRRLIADHMVYSKQTSAHVTTVAEVDLDHIVGTRDKNKDSFKAKMGFGLTYLPFIMMAAVRGLRDYPLLNSVVQGDTIITKKQIHMGVAVDSERGLMVPVIKGAGEMETAMLAKALNDLSVKVRDKKITPDELTGGTFTVSNPGKKGNLFGTPIISQPQVGILRMGEVVKRAVVVEADGEDAIAIRPMMYLALSYDHRIVDGLTANEFLHRVKEHLEQDDFPV
jgi:2-oxoglutarate dehydrogenase E2 component (dihydrolipoamide succinyltransferase)